MSNDDSQLLIQLNDPKIDDLSPFKKLRRNMLNGRKSRKNKTKIDISLLDIKNLWENQNGKCAITKLQMILPKSRRDTNVGPRCASIDRIDNQRGYSIDNIQLVCYSVNLARNKFPIDTIKEFFNEIVSVNK